MDTQSPERHVDITVVTAARNEVGNVAPFLAEVRSALATLALKGEVIFIDDGSSDGTSDAVRGAAAGAPDLPVRLIRYLRSHGLANALEVGFAHASGDLVCVLPADLESRPAADIPLLYAAMDAYADVVCGRRIRRGDGKALASDIFAKVNRWLFNVQVHDSNWIKLIRRDRLQGIRLYTDWHRFLVALLVYRGCRVKEVETVWRRREYGRSKFGFARMPAGLAGAIQVKAYLLWRDRSMLCFAHVALVSLLVAVLAALTALVVGSHHPAWVPAWGYSIAAQAVAVITIAIGLALDFTSWQRETDRPQPVDDNRL